MGALITRPSSGDGAPTLKRSEKILFKVNRGASSIYSTLLSLLRRDALRSTLTALLIWVVMVSAVRTLAMAAFIYITRFNVEDRATQI
jgi:hypothetical protein